MGKNLKEVTNFWGYHLQINDMQYVLVCSIAELFFAVKYVTQTPDENLSSFPVSFLITRNYPSEIMLTSPKEVHKSKDSLFETYFKVKKYAHDTQ